MNDEKVTAPRRLIDSLRRTIAAQRELLLHPRFTEGGTRVPVPARNEPRRIERRQYFH